MATQAVIDAEANLRKARDEAKQKHIAEVKADLKQLRQLAKALRKELAEIEGEVKESELGMTAARAELEAIDETIARLRSPTGPTIGFSK
jgi:septal ring factor EnvC (AmiA/AmiB activator)